MGVASYSVTFHSDGWFTQTATSNGVLNELGFDARQRVNISSIANGTIRGPAPETDGGVEYCLRASILEGNESKLLLSYTFDAHYHCDDFFNMVWQTFDYDCGLRLDSMAHATCKLAHFVSPGECNTFDDPAASSTSSSPKMFSFLFARVEPVHAAEAAPLPFGLPGLLAAAAGAALLLVLLTLAACTALHGRRRRTAARAKRVDYGEPEDVVWAVENEESEGASALRFGMADLQQVLDTGKREHWLLQPGSLQLDGESETEAGGRCRLHRGLLHSSTPVAVKMSQGGEEGQQVLLHELRILRRLRHNCIVQLCGVLVDNDKSLQLVLEWVGSRKASTNFRGYVLTRRAQGFFLQQAEALAAAQAAAAGPSGRRAQQVQPQRQVNEHLLLMDVARALTYLHCQKPAVIHRSLRPSSVLVDKELEPPQAKVTDFSLAHLLHPNLMASQPAGAKGYTAPEVTRGEAYGASADVFSFGCLALFACTAEEPDPTTALERVRELQAQGGCAGLEHASLAAEVCLAEQPGDRPGSAQVYTCLESGALPAPCGSTSSTADGGLTGQMAAL